MNKKKFYIVLAVVLGSVALLIGGITFAFYLAGLTGNGNDEDKSVEMTSVNLGTIKYDGVTTFQSNGMYPGEIGITSFTIEKGSQSGVGTYEIDINGSIDEEFGTDIKISLYKSTNGNGVSVTSGTLITSGNVAKEDTLVVGEGVEKVYGPYMLMNNNAKVLEVADFDTSTLADTTYYLVYEYKNNEIAPQNDQMGHEFSGKVSVRLIKRRETPVNECTYDGELVQGQNI